MNIIKDSVLDEEKSFDGLVCSLCRDYFRRKRCIEARSVGRRVRMEYLYLNHMISEASAEIVGAINAEIFIREIGEGIGYAKSDVDWMSEATYKKYKGEVKYNIGRKLHMCD